jgi:ABC-2 type transport system ATP-binding protein
VEVVGAWGLVKRYGALAAVNGVDLRVDRGEVVGILGPNGAGKTTLLRMLCGLVTPSAGRVRMLGLDLDREPEKVKARVGYLDEEPFLYPNLTGFEFLDFVADLYELPRGPDRQRSIGRWLELLELRPKGGELIGHYSHGMRQKIGLASLLIRQPEVLLLDEPTNGLDPGSARRIRDLLRELAGRGVTVLLSTHILEVAEALSHRLAIMSGGRMVALGPPAELRTASGLGDASLEEVFVQLTGGPDQRELIAQLLA